MLYYMNDLEGNEFIKSLSNYSLYSNSISTLKKYTSPNSTIYIYTDQETSIVYSPSAICEAKNFPEILSKLKYTLSKTLTLNVSFRLF